MARVRAGARMVIESDTRAVAVVRPAGEEFQPCLLSESIALAKKHAEELGCEPRMDPTSPPIWKRSSAAVSRGIRRHGSNPRL
jgi:hypothetical protein